MKAKSIESIVASRLLEAREALGLSQQALGVRAGIEEETAKVRIHYYERGKYVPTLSMLDSIARVLGKPLTWFFCEPDEQALISLLHSLPSAEREQALKAIEELLKEGLQNARITR